MLLLSQYFPVLNLKLSLYHILKMNLSVFIEIMLIYAILLLYVIYTFIILLMSCHSLL